MPFALRHRAATVSPCYGLPHDPQHRANFPNAAEGLPRAFRGARSVRQETGLRPCLRRERTGIRQPPDNTVWPAALAIMLVANLATPAAGMVPRRESHPDRDNEPGIAFDTTLAPQAPVPESSAFGGVAVRPVAHSSIKSDYTFHEFLSAVSAARAPFHYLGESVGDAYEVLSGQQVDPNVRRSVQIGADALDFVTGLLPNVPLLRLPGDVADLAVDEIEGAPPDPGKIAGLLQFGDPRSMRPAPPHDADLSRILSPSASRAATGSMPASHADIPRPDVRADGISSQVSDVVNPDEPEDEPEDGPGESEEVGAAHAPDTLRAAPVRGAGETNDPVRASPPLIVDEHEYLHGYEQPLPTDHLAADEASRLVVVSGHHYLKGDAGFYRAQRGLSANHWLIDAPQGSEHRAQVPVTYDESTGKWQAHAPLRLCGGGCGSSKPEYPSDSISDSYDEIFDAVRHIPDEAARDAIQYSFSELSALNLRRTNRADLQKNRDNSIVYHRTAMRESMSRRISPNAPLIKQQRTAASITAMYYAWNNAAEAFCQENAEILFYFLLQNNISKDRIRMITIKPQNRPPHVIVLYTESEHLIKLMDRWTPQPPHPIHRDGIGHDLFREAVYLTRHSTVLLDPWSKIKAISFAGVSNRSDAGRLISQALTDIGLTPGSPYTVSVTRPLGVHQANLSGSIGQVSAGSSGSSSSHPALNPPSRSGSPSSGDTVSSHGTGHSGSR